MQGYRPVSVPFSCWRLCDWICTVPNHVYLRSRYRNYRAVIPLVLWCRFSHDPCTLCVRRIRHWQAWYRWAKACSPHLYNRWSPRSHQPNGTIIRMYAPQPDTKTRIGMTVRWVYFATYRRVCRWMESAKWVQVRTLNVYTFICLRKPNMKLKENGNWGGRSASEYLGKSFTHPAELPCSFLRQLWQSPQKIPKEALYRWKEKW